MCLVEHLRFLCAIPSTAGTRWNRAIKDAVVIWANVSSEVCSLVSGSCWFVLARAERLESELAQAAASWIASFARGIAWKICMVLLIVIGFIAGASGHGPLQLSVVVNTLGDIGGPLRSPVPGFFSLTTSWRSFRLVVDFHSDWSRLATLIHQLGEAKCMWNVLRAVD